jgi:hypothetical protein
MSERLFTPLEECDVHSCAGMTDHYDARSAATVFHGDRLQLLQEIPDGSARLVVTSPPYNIGKQYEKKQTLES